MAVRRRRWRGSALSADPHISRVSACVPCTRIVLARCSWLREPMRSADTRGGAGPKVFAPRFSLPRASTYHIEPVERRA